MLKLDVGCGGEPKGDVNLDLFLFEDSPHTSQRIEPREIPNFILGDATALPIRDKTFDEVYCFHVLEHLFHPIACIEEMKRVSRSNVTIKVPNNPVMKEHREHLYSWSKSSLSNLISHFMEVNKIEATSFYLRSRDRKVVRLLSMIPWFQIRRKVFQLYSGFLGFELIAYCSVIE